MPAPLRDSAYKRLVRLGAASPKLTLGNVDANADEIITAIVKANDFGVDYLALPELCLVGATAGTLMRQPILLRAVRGALIRICEKTRNTGAIAAVGLPYDINGNIRSCVALVGGGRVYAIIPSDCACMPFGFLPELDYCGDGDCALTPIPRLALRFGNELFDDPANVRTAPRCAMLMPSALNATVNSCQRVRNALSAYSARTGAAIAYAAPGLGESVTSAVFDGICAIAANGEIVAAADPLSDNPFIFADVALSQLTPFEPYVAMEDNPSTYLSAQEATAKRQCERILDLQGAALSRRLTHINAKGFVIGVSGGVDSALSLLAAVNAMDKLGMERTRVTGVSMPGFGTTDRTKNNAKKLVKALSCTYREISVKEACLQHFADIGHNENTHDVVFENAQARERTKILLDIANMENLLNVGTGDLSEAALGWTTFAGDHLAQYAINASLPKTVIRRVLDVAKSRFPEAAEVLQSILDTPVSPELLPPRDDGESAQKTEEIVGPYALHDLFLFHMLQRGASPRELYEIACRETEFAAHEIHHTLGVFLKRFFAQQFKRNCAPEGPNLLLSIAPAYLTMPSDMQCSVWMKDFESIPRA